MSKNNTTTVEIENYIIMIKKRFANLWAVEAIMEVVNERLAAAHTRHSVSMYNVSLVEPKDRVAPNFAGAEAGGAEEEGGQTSDCAWCIFLIYTPFLQVYIFNIHPVPKLAVPSPVAPREQYLPGLGFRV